MSTYQLLPVFLLTSLLGVQVNGLTSTPRPAWANCSLSTKAGDVITNCTDRGLHSIPQGIPGNVTILYLRLNNFASIPANVFSNLSSLRELDLSSNKQSLSFSSDSFFGLHNLRALKLRYVSYLNFSGVRPFRHIGNLQTLLMKGSLLDKSLLESIFKDVPNLRYLSFNEDSGGPLPDSFSLLEGLDVLDLSGSTLNLTEETFIPLSNLKVTRLALRSLNIVGFHRAALKPLIHSLRVLDFTCNNEFKNIGIKSQFFSPIVECVENSTILQTLILDGSYDYDYAVTLSDKQFTPLKRVPLKALSLQNNAITVFETFTKYLKHIQYFNMDYNMPLIANGDSQKMWFSFLRLRHLKEVGLSYQYLFGRDIGGLCSHDVTPLFFRDFPDANSAHAHDRSRLTRADLNEAPHSDSTTVKIHVPLLSFNFTNVGFALPPILVDGENVHTVDARNLSLGSFQLNLTVDLRLLNVSNNFISSIEWAIYGLDNLKIFDISNNNLLHVHRELFRALTGLQHLLASKNRIGLLTSLADLVATFSDLENLETADLSFNQLSSVPEGMFSNCRRLQTLLLHHNNIKTVGLRFDTMPRLRTVDLSFNEITTFSDELTVSLLNVNFSMKLTNVSGFKCSQCENIAFYRWVQSNKSSSVLSPHDKCNLTCHTDNGSIKRIIDIHIYQFYLFCIRDLLIGISAGLTVIAISTLLLGWHYRWNIKYWIYMLKLKRRGDAFADDARRFHVYLSYDDDDYMKADTIFRALEQTGLFVFFRDRDTVVGGDIYEEYFRGIDSSKKVVLCLTENYLNSAERYFELRMSVLRGRGFIIPVVMGDFSLEKLSKPLRHLLRDDVYLEWPTDDTEAEEFWKSLVQAVTTVKGICIRKGGAVIYRC